MQCGDRNAVGCAVPFHFELLPTCLVRVVRGFQHEHGKVSQPSHGKVLDSKHSCRRMSTVAIHSHRIRTGVRPRLQQPRDAVRGFKDCSLRVHTLIVNACQSKCGGLRSGIMTARCSWPHSLKRTLRWP
jgi:hypothetical protein